MSEVDIIYNHDAYIASLQVRHSYRGQKVGHE